MSPLKIVLLALILLAIVAGLYRQRIIRVYHVVTLFYADRIVANFRSMDSMFNTVPVHRAPIASPFDRAPTPLPATFPYQGQNKNLPTWLDETWTTGLVVIRDSAVTFEGYYRGNAESTRTISWSLAKSFVSALFGIAVAEGHIASIQDPVTQYVPLLKGSGYDGVAIKDVLQMSSGVRFDEDYAAFFSDINRMGRAIAFNSSIDAFVASLKNERPPGTYNQYVSMDTQVLAMVLRETTGETIGAYTESRLWRKIGMESDAYWLVDSQGMALAFGGLNAVLRDYARFGLLYLQEGMWNGVQVIPKEWISASITPDAPHLQPGPNDLSNTDFGYGYQWWIPPDSDGDFLAIGIYEQYLYIHPRHRTVIAKSSAYPDYDRDGEERTLEAIAAFRTIAAQAIH
ncbi:MAG: serine hydrolase [Candidatus Latescibacterota bacterium]|nr:serine hydrolase [Candidatus Latescibacterota bacterium]